MLNKKYQSQEQAIATYDYVDIAAGTGMVDLYGASTYQGGATTYILTEEPIYSSYEFETAVASSATTYTSLIDLDFDMTAFNSPRTIRGTGYVNVAVSTHPGADTSYLRVIATLRKWNGTSETDIVTATSKEITAASPATTKRVLAIALAIPETFFKIGEILRLNIVVQGYRSSSGSFDTAVAYDPMDRDGNYIIPSTDSPATTTKLIFKCPFELDI